MPRLISALAIVVSVAASLFSTTAAAQFSAKLPKNKEPELWLDKAEQEQDKAPKIWNKSGNTIPHAPRHAELDPQCRAGRYVAVTPEEKSLVKAGWFLMSRGLEHNGVIVVGAQAANDGMCRPLQYQQFVFVHGRYAGTLSPGLMDSRIDGAASDIVIPGDGRVVADFLRYSEKDPLCCPSRVSEVTYEIQEQAGGSIIVVKNVKTRRTE
jgi:hypothetical protein